ncbi:VWA domain-containing protein [Rhodospirillaceae bacterium KN72]|uniref:VWA domain-containing protein n=1 Tax=Pacificispira spongiicola TaxID=2729598 RepID=A0A7Y0HFS8_9PROT|nr:VWA domain-containing protein [Pacificispira spongiicola]NMM44212.1 VWA domain-containing protein [Pacificispira spongiicola]
MFPTLFFKLKAAGVPVSLREYLSVVEGLSKDVCGRDTEQFYYFARTALVKDERYLDRFDRVFSEVFKGVLGEAGVAAVDLPTEWLMKLAEKHLSDEEKAMVEALGGFEKLMETLKQRLAEQEKRHQGGSKWIGTAGTSPFGAYGYNPEGVRIGQEESRHRRAVKVWDKREFKNLDTDEPLSNRNMKVALRRLRRFARTGSRFELDLGNTIRKTADNGGYVDIQWQREKHNAVKIIALYDVGGSMDDHILDSKKLFDAMETEFKHLVSLYFHNYLYENLFSDMRNRYQSRVSTWDFLRTYSKDYKVVFVGDATMSPYEIVYPGGSVEHWNDESGQVWMQRILDHFDNVIWLNPQPQERWGYYQSIKLVRDQLEDRMFPMTVQGLDDAMRALA